MTLAVIVMNGVSGAQNDPECKWLQLQEFTRRLGVHNIRDGKQPMRSCAWAVRSDRLRMSGNHRCLTCWALLRFCWRSRMKTFGRRRRAVLQRLPSFALQAL